MELQMIDINSITPDKNQPRHTIDLVRVREMAKSILTEGVINPIEIDEKNVIVTGEIRWRSAKEAGLKEIPCKIVHYEGRDRFRRQVVENIHHNTMTTMDTAESLSKLLKYIPRKRRLHGEKGFFQETEIGDLSREIGKTTQFIRDYLSLLKESSKVMEWLRKPESKMSLIREINKFSPEEAKEELKEKVISGDINNYRIATELSKAIKQAPDKKNELLAVDWSKATDNGVKKIHEIAQIVEPIDDIETAQDITRAIQYMAELNIFFSEHLPDDFPLPKIAEMKVTFNRMVELGNAFLIRTAVKGELT
jgi:ParB/RepB/Spo0J family partition protein